MEQEIRKSFCNYCVNQGKKNCMEIKIEDKEDMLLYKCINYQFINCPHENIIFDYNIRSNK